MQQLFLGKLPPELLDIESTLLTESHLSSLLEKEGKHESAFPLAFPAPEGQIVPLCSASALAPSLGSMISQQGFFLHFCLPSTCPLPLSLPLAASATATFSSLPLALLFLINNLLSLWAF